MITLQHTDHASSLVVEPQIMSVQLEQFQPGSKSCPALYERVPEIPKHPLWFNDANGAIFELAAAIVEPEVAGALGDGAEDDTVAIEACVSYGAPIMTRPRRTYRVTRFENIIGVPIIGLGKILLEDRGLLRQVNRYSDGGHHAIGKEYLYGVHRMLQAGQPITVHLFGDSTISGGHGETVPIPVALTHMFSQVRANAVIHNHGVSGTCVHEADILPFATSPALLVIKYGINEAGVYSQNSQDGILYFAHALRAKLREIRLLDCGDISRISILLVGPNAAFDPINHRDERWFSALSAVYQQAARDFGCAFFDSYGYVPDGARGVGLWLDDFGGGFGVHPQDLMNAWIWGGVFDYCFGGSQSVYWNSAAAEAQARSAM